MNETAFHGCNKYTSFIKKINNCDMNSIMDQYSLRPGDEIIVPKSRLNMIKHHAMYLGQDLSSAHWIVENRIGDGVRTTTADAFFEDVDQITAIERFRGSDHERKLLVNRALSLVGRPYNLIKYNCEHFTSELRTGIPESKQVSAFALAILGVLLISAFLTD